MRNTARLFVGLMKPEDHHPALLKRPPRQLVRSPPPGAKLRGGAGQLL
jgi:hypothetical protein